MEAFANLLVVATLPTGCSVSFNNGPEERNRPGAETEAQQRDVAKVANAYLEMLDSGAPGATWDQAGPYLVQISNVVGSATHASSVCAFNPAIQPESEPFHE